LGGIQSESVVVGYGDDWGVGVWPLATVKESTPLRVVNITELPFSPTLLHSAEMLSSRSTSGSF
jgi:hypothetical protein